MTMTGIEYFPDLGDWTEDNLTHAGYRRISLSMFDHWLTPEEWSENPFVSLERARACGLEPAYRQQNRRFRSFYHCLLRQGVYRLTGLRSKPQVAWHARWDRRLKKAVTAMVEDRAWGAEFYVPAHRVRISSGDARTDTMLLEHDADEEAIEKLATRHELKLIK